jgi:cardiolipin synthase
MDLIPQNPDAMEKLKQEDSCTDDLVTYLNRSGCFPVYNNTEATYFPIGEDKFEAMLEELAKAEKYIFMEYFIIEEGYMWGRILNILIEKAKAGVDVRVMYDGMCEMSTLPTNYCKLLKAEGIQAKAFAPIVPLISSHYNYRDHRKICVIDGKTAFTGGVNLADEYINEIERFGHWKDTAVMLKGDAVRSFTLMFLQMWNVNEKEPDFTEAEEAVDFNPDNPSGYVIPYCDCPLDEDKVGEAVYMDILNRAGEYVHIMTPYLILDGELETALKYAGQRGIDVKLILPGIPDKPVPYSLAKAHYASLLDAGVKIYEYTPGFVHAKVFVSDDEKGVVGTINLDYRSLYHHFECATYLYRTDCIPDLERDFQETLAKCRQVTKESLKDEKLFYKIMGPIAKFIAPLL